MCCPVFTGDDERTAAAVAERLGISEYRSQVLPTDKAEVIQAVLKALGDPPKEQVVMVGDRKHDILGAKALGLQSIGVDYGFAPPGELEEAGADWTVPTVEGLQTLCLSLCGADNG